MTVIANDNRIEIFSYGGENYVHDYKYTFYTYTIYTTLVPYGVLGGF